MGAKYWHAPKRYEVGLYLQSCVKYEFTFEYNGNGKGRLMGFDVLLSKKRTSSKYFVDGLPESVNRLPILDKVI